MRGQWLLRGLSNTGVSVLYSNLDLNYVWAQNVPPAWTREDIAGKRDEDFFEAANAATLTDCKRRAIDTRVPQQLELGLQSSNGTLWFSLWVDCDRDTEGELRGLIMTAVDITEHKWREQTLRTLLREVAHRSKNLLAIIQSIATQTGRHSETVEDFLSRFRGRLQSLASTQDLVTSSNWRGADLRELAINQVARYAADPRRSIVFEGRSPYLNPNAALHVGLALHELAVNSVSYGALARPDGTISIETVESPTDGGLTLVWKESISLGDQTLGQKRFGSIALERVVPASLNGSATMQISSDRLEYRLVIPANNFELE